jgi:hypothetical protein
MVMARARCRLLSCLLLSLALAGCHRLVSTEGTESAARTRVKFILQTIRDHGNGTDVALQTAICRWHSDKIFISDRDEQSAAADAFDNWRQEGGIYPTLQTYAVAENAQERHPVDPEGTWYVAVTIDGLDHLLRVPPKGQIGWADGIHQTPGAKRRAVVITEEEVQRKRAEWNEHERMVEQSQAELQAWRRSRAPAEQALPHVGAAQPRTDASVELARSMRAWHRHYSERSTAVSLALSQLGMVERDNPPDPSRVLAACRTIRAASQALFADPQALAAPLPTVSEPLTSAYTEIQAAAVACLASRADDQAAHLAAARQAMAQAGTALRPFQLMP